MISFTCRGIILTRLGDNIGGWISICRAIKANLCQMGIETCAEAQLTPATQRSPQHSEFPPQDCKRGLHSLSPSPPPPGKATTTAVKATTAKRADLKNCIVVCWLLKRMSYLLEVGMPYCLSFYTFPLNLTEITCLERSGA